MIKKILLVSMSLLCSVVFADVYSDCDTLILMDKYEDSIKLVDEKIDSVESAIGKAQLLIRKYFAQSELNKKSVDVSEIDSLYSVGKNSYDFRLILAAYYFSLSKNSDNEEDKKIFAEKGESNIRVSANMFPNNKKYYIYSAKIFSDCENGEEKPVYYNPSFSISLLRKYFMLDKTDFLGYCMMIKSLNQRNWSLEERIAGVNDINMKLRRLSDPVDKNRYLEGFKNFASFYEYAPGKQFLSVSDSEEANLINKYIDKFKLTEEQRNYYSKNIAENIVSAI